MATGGSVLLIPLNPMNTWDIILLEANDHRGRKQLPIPLNTMTTGAVLQVLLYGEHFIIA
jgi:hypothetical protein